MTFLYFTDLTGKCDYDFSCLEKSKDIILNFNESICYQPRRKINLKCRFYDEAVDVAILEMMNITGLEEDVPKGLFLWQYDIALLGVTKISTIGYGHVHNQLEKHLETCEILRDLEERLREALVSLHQKGQEYKDNLVTNRHDPLSVDIGYTGLDNQSFIVFDCYMGKGLSGAPILTNEGNSATVIGIVLGGLPDFYYKLSPEKQASFQKRFLFEVGRKMKTIYEIIFSKDQNLAKQLFNGK